jgi:hypothetical protein
MNTNDLRRVSGIFGILAIIADIITIILFLKDIFVDGSHIEFKYISTQIIFIVFIFSVALIFGFKAMKSDWHDKIKEIGSMFSWIYIILSATIFILVSYRFIIDCDYTLIEYVSMLGLIFLITFLALFIAFKIDRQNPAFAIPYMLVFLWQISLFLYNFILRNHFDFTWYFVGNIMLLTITTLFLFFLVYEYDFDDHAFKLKNPFYFSFKNK